MRRGMYRKCVLKDSAVKTDGKRQIPVNFLIYSTTTTATTRREVRANDTTLGSSFLLFYPQQGTHY